MINTNISLSYSGGGYPSQQANQSGLHIYHGRGTCWMWHAARRKEPSFRHLLTEKASVKAKVHYTEQLRNIQTMWPSWILSPKNVLLTWQNGQISHPPSRMSNGYIWNSSQLRFICQRYATPNLPGNREYDWAYPAFCCQILQWRIPDAICHSAWAMSFSTVTSRMFNWFFKSLFSVRAGYNHYQREIFTTIGAFLSNDGLISLGYEGVSLCPWNGICASNV